MTGTLTQDRIILKRRLDIGGHESERVLEYAYLNSHYQSGLKNLLDVGVLQHIELGKNLHLQHQYKNIDEIPFDFVRRRLSVILSREDETHVLICKGAVEEVFAACKFYELDGEIGNLDRSHLTTVQAEIRALNEDGFRVVAVASRVD
jgi:P-type Mg2+ transporter